MIRSPCLALLPLCLLLACGDSRSPEGERPNFILIIGDDHGYPDFGFTSSEWVRTPNLDQLAAEGTLFTLAHTTASMCLPSLNSLLTGLYPRQFALRASELRREAGIPPHPPPNRERPGGSEDIHRRPQVLGEYRIGERFAIEQFDTLPRLLARRGYVSFQAGKYFEGDYRAAGFSAGMTGDYDPVRFPGGEGLRLGRESMDEVYEFIDAHRDEPFFVWFAPLLPHIPHSAPERFVAPYADTRLSEAARRYYASCTWFDHLVGELVGFLAQRGLREQTILIYLSDNGWVQGPFGTPQGRDEAFLGGPSGKGSLHDLGFRTPIIFNGPGRVPESRVSEELVSSVDIVPTLLDFAGIEAPDGLPGASLRPLLEGDGVSIRDTLVGSMRWLRPPAGSPRANTGALLEPTLGFYARTADWHFIAYEDRGIELLYDARRDPHGRRDVSDEHPEVVVQLRAEIERWKQEIGPYARPGRQQD